MGMRRRNREPYGLTRRELRDVILVIDSLLPQDEAAALSHFEEQIRDYVKAAILEGLTITEIRQDLDTWDYVAEFGPWGIMLDEERLYLIANCELLSAGR